MPEVCENISRIAKDIRGMLSNQHKTGLNQTAALDGNKITDIKATRGAYHRTPKGKAVIYTGQAGYPTLEPNSRDVREMVEHERPFMCRCVTAFGVPQAVCYTPGDAFYQFVKDDIEQTEEFTEELKSEIMTRWGTDKPQTDAEKVLMHELRKREHELDDILDSLAPKIIKTCKVSLR